MEVFGEVIRRDGSESCGDDVRFAFSAAEVRTAK